MQIMPRQGWVRVSLISFVMGALSGVLFSPLLVRAVSLMSADMLNHEILLVSGVVMALYLPSFLAVRLTTRRLMALVAQIGQGTAFALLTSYAVDAALSCALIGVIVMGAISLAARRQPLTDAHLMIAALGIGLLTFILNMVGHGFMLDLATTAALLGITLLGAAVAAWFANRLTRWIAPTALGQWMMKVISL